MKLPWAILCCLSLVFLSFSDSTIRTDPTIEIAFLGDVMLGRSVAQAHTSGDWASALAEIKPELNAADLAIANLESPMTSAPLVRQAYDLRAPQAGVQAFTSAGIDLLSLANNHALDCGPEGLEDTRSALQANHLTPVGPLPQAARLLVNHHSLSMIALDDVSAAMDVDQAAAAVRDARQSSNWVVVFIHWGAEYSPGPSPRQVTIARRLAGAGADLIIGHHPHVLQPGEWIDNPGGNHRTFVAYSLGNALFDQPTPPDARRGVLLSVRLGPGGVAGITPVPFTIDWSRGRIQKASPAETVAILHRLALPN
ncbi:MAG: CapA family protein [Chloroflexi bacterium]|nr:CapA family protein [Chloroflexota bacterium]